MVARARARGDLRAEATGSAALALSCLRAGEFGAALRALEHAQQACAALGSGGLRLEAFGTGRVVSNREPVVFRSHNAGRAVFLLALAGAEGMHMEQLADRLWPDRDCDRRRLCGRVRTLLWDLRQGLGSEAWRMHRCGPHLQFDTAGVPIDFVGLRLRAQSALETGDVASAAKLAGRLRRPLLTRWAYDEWVLTEAAVNEALAHRLDMLASGRDHAQATMS